MEEKIKDLINDLTAMIEDNEKKTDDYSAGCVSTAILIRELLKHIVK